MFKPETTSEAFFLARMQQASLHQMPKPLKSFFKPFVPPLSIPPPSSTFGNSNGSSSQPIVTHPTTLTKNSPDKTLPPIRRLTYAQMQKRKDKGLCYNCDEFYRHDHKCKTQHLFMLITDEDMEESDPISPAVHQVDSPPPSDSTMEISLHALTGNVVHDTIRIAGHLHKKPIMILIDTGSTHSFIDFKLTEQLGIHASPRCHMTVTVANGDSTIIHDICNTLGLEMKANHFSFDLRVLPLGGYDMVLEDDCASAFKKFVKSKVPTLLGQFFVISTSPPPTTPPFLTPLVDSYSDIFAEPSQLPLHRALDHKIPLKPHSSPTYQRPYRFPYIQKSVLENMVQEMLNSGLIQKSNSPFTSPILLVKKKDGTWWFCVDYRKLNDMTIRLFGPDMYKTAFKTHHGHYEFRFMPFGLTNAPSTFQALMNDIFQPFLSKFVLGVAADPEKIEAMQTWHPLPSTLKQLRGIVGLTDYYRIFIQGYGTIPKPLTDMLKKDAFHWTADAHTAFTELKVAMTRASVLALPDFSKQFPLETDACARGAGAILMQ
ncbi:uncharacterized protein LOC113312098 [Papaver somniferum]|uniref:uncharacterized protein LOC113312098 n=1 Tax=Papaver somniferum TaxID=3469 RepID=UPI000E704081|nr:uncharacterized protein LOC113312098 [Papaver somniferum]